MDIVIPLGNSKINYLDLRYVLRGIEKFTAPSDIYIIGQKPTWITGVKHIPFPDNPKKEYKERNIYNKTREAFYHTEQFLFMNDDHVFLRDTDINTYPNYYKGTCYQSMLKNNSHYRGTMNHTKKWLEAKGFPDLNYDGHCPLIIENSQFKQVRNADWGIPFGYGMKSIYCAGLKGEHRPDVKMYQKLSCPEAIAQCHDQHVVSFTDAAIKTGLGEYFEFLFPNPSKYEKS